MTSELRMYIFIVIYNNYCLICFSRLRKQIFVFFRVMESLSFGEDEHNERLDEAELAIYYDRY